MLPESPNTKLLPQRCILAPMEGVVDAAMREFMTRIGGYTRCVTEFVRVTDVLLPPKVFYRLCSELHTDGHTKHGIPVYVQLLGSDPDALAVNAVRAAELGAPGIDLNFGCPAKTVNKSQGGSILLRRPDHVADIVRVVRDAVPHDIPVTAKIRIGYDSSEELATIVDGVARAGADELTIHARTKFDGYKPPAYWSVVGDLDLGFQDWININGEIWKPEDACKAQSESACKHLMLGRGALAAPDLALRVLRSDSNSSQMLWSELLACVEQQFHQVDCNSPRHTGNRTKQWLAYLRRNYPQASLLFKRIRTLHDSAAIGAAFEEHRLKDLVSYKEEGEELLASA